MVYNLASENSSTVEREAGGRKKKKQLALQRLIFFLFIQVFQVLFHFIFIIITKTDSNVK